MSMFLLSNRSQANEISGMKFHDFLSQKLRAHAARPTTRWTPTWPCHQCHQVEVGAQVHF